MSRISRSVSVLSLLLLPFCAFSQSSPSVTTLYTFPSTDSLFSAPLMEAGDGNIYGVASSGGADGFGYVYRVNGATQVVSPFYTFTGGANGLTPVGGVTQGSDGNLYGTTAGFMGKGTVVNAGTIFKLTLSGTLTTLHSFTSATDGSTPLGTLVQGTDGNFYGMTVQGGANGLGTLFKISSSGTFTKILDFTSATGGWNTNSSQSTLVQANDGNFYGVSGEGGANNYGDIFQLTPAGVLTVLYSFTNGADGVGPIGGLVQASDGYLYGVTSDTFDGGALAPSPTIFKISTAGAFTTLFSLGSCAENDGINGSDPTAGLFLAGNGDFYGATRDSGSGGCGPTGGTLYEFAAPSTYNVEYDFPSTINGPTASFFQPDGGSLASTTPGNDGGGHGTGDATIFGLSFTPAIPKAVQLTISPNQINLGQTVTATWVVANGFSTTLQQCYASEQTGNSHGGWSGKQTGTVSGSGYSGSATIQPTAAGDYHYTLVCGGGMEAGTAGVTVGSTPLETSTSMSVSPNYPADGQTLTLQATVAALSGGAAPTGTVKFAVGATTLATVALTSGVANLTASTTAYPVGTYLVTAIYSGDSTHQASSTNFQVFLSKNQTTTVMTATPNPVPANSSVTLSATVTRADGTGFATGSVKFYFGTTLIGTANLNGSGVAKLTASDTGIPAGAYAIDAVYQGDASDVTSTSADVTVTVE